MTTSYEATKRWREAHPDKARRIGTENARRKRRADGVPCRGDRGSYIEAMEARQAKRKRIAQITKKAAMAKKEGLKLKLVKVEK